MAITLNAFRTRFLDGEARDPRYDALEVRLRQTKQLACPALMVQGGSDFCDEPRSSEDLERFFTGGYSGVVLSGAGHFPHREALLETAKAVVGHRQA
jgi:pimeloyl-ACP methyl ester carboxylesterase